MSKKNSGSFLQALQRVIEKEGVFVEELLLGVIVLMFWGGKKEPEEVLYRPYIARSVREIRDLKENP